MENVTELVEKYFRGETSLAEEAELKRYFRTDNVLPEHEMYRSLFEVFDQKLLEKANFPSKKVLPQQRKMKRTWIQTFAYSGIAATLLLALWIQRPKQTDNYAIIGGHRIENSEYVQQYTVKKLNKVNHILAKSMEPMQTIETVRRNLKPINKVAETRKIMIDIQNKLQFK